MFRRIQGLILGLDERRNPFDPQSDIANHGYLFLYVTGRGEYSYLFAPMEEEEILRAADEAVPMGYAQLMVLEWVQAFHPAPGVGIKPSERRAGQDLSLKAAREGRSYALIGENGEWFGCAEKLPTAMSAARSIAAEKRVRVALGLVKSSLAWR